ncbi:bifunctional (p)ppGpp synthetase/guanosine-3',5'-bis(diphosphate) 3'-pyrophosphohydrolase [Asticcacaulis sp. EMRT-3]|uniref:RelA/SpoT family protein n=1 Tax=Asticcacaulis sp. EMRT-3 TaxID=3040349 RepID=UPI0024AEBAF1|nr:bifunctional (p)ppGpp synthetase/guanosine-3',5'-bis(diphosphate) 3'-pyrophosphohydrolase [Asticcacaulis sp. EMRT-3]MDI7774367.1 bifunctional (p)ppGpp synthetase/guanosine-3',5'-bis(diphosphate) 3'-pyrophosphohydrolase [Asticcacaulis sp. EMRT-3]
MNADGEQLVGTTATQANAAAGSVASAPQPVSQPAPARPRFLRQVELIERVAAYDPTVDEAMLNRAYVYAMRMHGAQLRASGDPYFAHPIEVAGILTDYKLDSAAIATALLHDTIEDTPATREDIASMFGEDVAQLVEGVTKLTRLELQSEYTKSAENLRKFILAIAKDVRVLLVKLADRLHNMRTLQYVPEHKRERISRETIEVYAPLARSIGCNRFATELEDLAFSFINPRAHKAIIRRLEEMRKERGDTIAAIARDVAARLEKAGMFARVSGREKSPYSIWRKLQRKSVGFNQLSDIYAFRVVMQNVDDCYRALGILHSTWPCVQERFKDFISTPKSNNYKSLHTTVVGHKGTRIELQIRTAEMDRIAEEGVAAHWGYKNQTYGFDEEAATADGGRNPINSLRNIVSIVENGGDSEDWVEHAKMEMYLDQVFVFSPKGRLISLPRGAMPLDFAFAVHTEVGETAIGCLINGEHRPLRTVLQNGDQVEILTGLESRVNQDWFSLTTTGKARAAIRRHLRQSEREDFIKVGKVAVERAAAQVDKGLDDISWRPAFDRFNVTSEDELFELCGRGKILPAKILEAIFPGLKLPMTLSIDTLTRIRDSDGGMAFVRGTALHEGHKIFFSTCCHPVPGDRIVGIVEADGVHVHSIECETLEALEAEKDRWIDLHWTLNAEKNTLSVARLRVNMQNKPGVLGQACTLIGEARGNIVNIALTSKPYDFLDVDFDIEVLDARHIINISAGLRTSPMIESVERVRGEELGPAA